jgi:GT2 family glycosyltransferase
MRNLICCVVPNWNGEDEIGTAVASLLKQKVEADVKVIVVDNGSVDGSVELLKRDFPAVDLVELPKNRGFAGGVNAGITRAKELMADYVALFNNDADAEDGWLAGLFDHLQANPGLGIATGKLVRASDKTLDSTGECYSSWGLPYPRGRGEPMDSYPEPEEVFGATGGASLYRMKMLDLIGSFDEDFFAYYEDVDLSFRAQLAGWRVGYVPTSIAYHQIGLTSGRIPGFTTYQTFKNLPLLFWKNVPLLLIPIIMPKLVLANIVFYLKACARGQFLPATKGVMMAIALSPKKFIERYNIQKRRQADITYIRSLIKPGRPPKPIRSQE